MSHKSAHSWFYITAATLRLVVTSCQLVKCQDIESL